MRSAALTMALCMLTVVLSHSLAEGEVPEPELYDDVFDAPTPYIPARDYLVDYSRTVARVVKEAVLTPAEVEDGGWQIRVENAFQDLGSLRALEGVRVLFAKLMTPTHRRDLSAGEVGYIGSESPAADALVNIGKAGSISALRRIPRADEPKEREVLAWIVMQVEGTDVALFMLNARAEAAKDEARARLLEAVEWVQEQRHTESRFAQHAK